MSLHNIRVSDRIDLIDFEKNGFIQRKSPGRQALKILILALITLLIAAVMIYNEARTGSIFCIVSGMLMMYVAVLFERQRKILLTSDFMSALFSSALGKQSAFICIARRDGEVLYFNKKFQLMFPNFVPQEKRNLNTLCALYGVPLHSMHELANNLSKASDTTLNFEIDTPLGKQPFVITLEPIERPTGFILVRGKQVA